MAAAVILGGGSLIVLGLTGDGGSSGPGLTSLTGAREQSPEEKAKAERARRAKQLDDELQKVATTSPDFSVAVLNRRTGQTYAYRGAVQYDTASIVKAQILACMLLRAQDKDRKPSAAEMELAGPMIRSSDNDATTALFQRLGGKAAVDKCNQRLGLTQTVVDRRWGFTRTTATDQVKLLNEFVDQAGPLSTASRKTAFTLMNSVDDAQTWGVPSIAKPGETTTVKNGWDTRSAEGGLWAINTIGRVTSPGGVDVSVAVLSHKDPTMDEGVALVEKVAQLTRQYLKY